MFTDFGTLQTVGTGFNILEDDWRRCLNLKTNGYLHIYVGLYFQFVYYNFNLFCIGLYLFCFYMLYRVILDTIIETSEISTKHIARHQIKIKNQNS